MALLDELLDYLQAKNVGVQNKTLWATTMPETPDALVVISQYGGRSPDGELGAANPVVKYPRIQVRNRALKYTDAEAKAREVYRAMTSVVNQDLGGHWYLNIWPIQDPAMLEQDENHRAIFFCNYEVQRVGD